MNKEIILIILAPLIMGLVWWYQDKKKKEQELSDRLYQAENNITHLNNVNYKTARIIYFLCFDIKANLARCFVLASMISLNRCP